MWKPVVLLSLVGLGIFSLWDVTRPVYMWVVADGEVIKKWEADVAILSNVEIFWSRQSCDTHPEKTSFSSCRVYEGTGFDRYLYIVARLSSPRKVEGPPMVLLANPKWPTNYYHSLNDNTLPLYGAIPSLEPNVVLGGVWFSRWSPVRFYMKRLGYRVIDLAGEGRIGTFGKVYLVEHAKDFGRAPFTSPNHSRDPVDQRNAPVVRRFVAKVLAALPPIRRERDLGTMFMRLENRKLVNQDALKAYSTTPDFQRRVKGRLEWLFPESFTKEGMLVRMQQSAVVMGTHGAALTNCMFLKPGGVCVQLLTHRFREDGASASLVFKNICALLNTTYFDHQEGIPNTFYRHWLLYRYMNRISPNQSIVMRDPVTWKLDYDFVNTNLYVSPETFERVVARAFATVK